MGVQLSFNERATIEALEARLSEQARFSITLEKLLLKWKVFVGEVEQGYWGTVDDYTNDLCTRDLIEEMLSTPGVPRRKLEGLVSPLDQKFEQATCQDDEHRLARFFRTGDGWWWSRIPAKLGELASYL